MTRRGVESIVGGLTVAFIMVSVGPAIAQTSAKGEDNEPYVLILTASDKTAESVLQRYPEITSPWRELADYNVLREGNRIELTRAMLTRDKILAKVASFYGETEVRRSFDARFLPVVKHLLLREGDVIRTWRRSGGRILFEDGSFVLLRSNSRAKLKLLAPEATHPPARVQLELLEGGLWSHIKRQTKGQFEIRTPGANTIIRGTDFRLKVEVDEATRLEVLEGRVVIEAGGGSVAVATGKGILSPTGETPGEPRNLPPAPPGLVAPQPKQVFRGESFDETFRWHPVANAVGYRVELARDEAFFDMVEERRTGPETTLRLSGLEPGTYFWRVTALDAAGFESPPTAASYFVVVRTEP